MNISDLKIWLDGYMAGAGDNADFAVLAAKVKEVTEPFANLKFPVGARMADVGVHQVNPQYNPNQCRTVAS